MFLLSLIIILYHNYFNQNNNQIKHYFVKVYEENEQ